MIATTHHRFEELASFENVPGLQGCAATQLLFMYRKSIQFHTPVILELGTATGTSTTVFLQACEEKDGRLVSVDIADCSHLSDSGKWQFVKSDSTDVESILASAPILGNGIDVLYIDSLHHKDHVEKELTSWYPYMSEKSWIFFDDVDSNPYRKGNRKDSFFSEVCCDEIHDYVKSFFYANADSTNLSIVYGSTGLACLQKSSPVGTKPIAPRHTVRRRKTPFNILRYNPRMILSSLLRRWR